MASPAAVSAALPVANDFGALPTWDLNDLYPGLESAELKRDLAQVAERATALQKSWKGKVATASGDELAGAIAEYEQLQDLIGRMYSYASLAYAGDMADPKIAGFYQDMQEKLNDITTKGNTSARRFKRAMVLLRADEGHGDDAVAAMVPIGVSGGERKLDSRQEATLVALACTKPPDGGPSSGS